MTFLHYIFQKQLYLCKIFCYVVHFHLLIFPYNLQEGVRERYIRSMQPWVKHTGSDISHNSIQQHLFVRACLSSGIPVAFKLSATSLSHRLSVINVWHHQGTLLTLKMSLMMCKKWGEKLDVRLNQINSWAKFWVLQWLLMPKLL